MSKDDLRARCVAELERDWEMLIHCGWRFCYEFPSIVYDRMGSYDLLEVEAIDNNDLENLMAHAIAVLTGRFHQLGKCRDEALSIDVLEAIRRLAVLYAELTKGESLD